MHHQLHIISGQRPHSLEGLSAGEEGRYVLDLRTPPALKGGGQRIEDSVLSDFVHSICDGAYLYLTDIITVLNAGMIYIEVNVRE